MKNLITIVAALALLATGCRKSVNVPTAPATEPAIPASLAGSWSPQQATVNGTLVPLSQLFGWQVDARSARLTFGSDGSYSYVECDAQGTTLSKETGTVSIGGSRFTILVRYQNEVPLNPRREMSGTWTVSGNQLVLTFLSGGDTVVILCTKV